MTVTIAGPAATPRPLIASAGIVVALTLVLAISAHIQIPFWPVPITLQTLAVLTIAGVFGARIAGATLIAYLVEGACGLPVFASGGGLPYLVGPTAGYLAGMLVASVLVGALARRARGRVLGTGAAMLVGIVLVYAIGAGWLASFVGAEKALALGVVPFLAGDAVKTALAAALTVAARRA